VTTIHQDIFYPNDREELKQMVQPAVQEKGKTNNGVKALITPHAGYGYIKDLLIDAYKRVSANAYKRVVILYPSHQGPMEADKPQFIFAPADESMTTPLGEVTFDTTAIATLSAKYADMKQSNTYLEEEPSVELNLPFIQILFPEAKLIPLCCIPVKSNQVKTVAQIIEDLQTPDTLFILSANANQLVQKTLCLQNAENLVKSLSEKEPLLSHVRSHEITCCGAGSIEAINRVFKQEHWEMITFEAKGNTAKTLKEVAVDTKAIYHLSAVLQ